MTPLPTEGRRSRMNEPVAITSGDAMCVNPSPLSWRIAIAGGMAALALVAYGLRELIGLRGQSVAGVIFFFGLIALFSRNLRAINWRTVAYGMGVSTGAGAARTTRQIRLSSV